jgi:hypothetical protein
VKLKLKSFGWFFFCKPKRNFQASNPTTGNNQRCVCFLAPTRWLRGKKNPIAKKKLITDEMLVWDK